MIYAHLSTNNIYFLKSTVKATKNTLVSVAPLCVIIKVCLPGLQSVKREQIDSKTFEIVKAGLQLSLRMSRQMTP